MDLTDRLQTIVTTAVFTSMAWIVVAGTLLDIGPKADPGGPAPAAAPHLAAAVIPVQSEIGSLIVPVAGIDASKLTDTFSDARGGGSRAHEAIDIIAPAGTPVLAAASGTVERLFASKDGGNTIYVRSAENRAIEFYYAHLQAYAPGLKEGQTVTQGQPVGLVGQTGNATTPHLHFAIMRIRADARWWETGPALNPYPLLTGR